MLTNNYLNQINKSQINKNIWKVLFVLSFAIAILFNACSQPQELKTLRIGMNSWPGYSIALYAKEAKLFEKRGVNRPVGKQK